MDGRIPGMVLDPRSNSVLYAVGEFTGVWKSVDAAQTWRQSSSGLRNGITQMWAYPSLAIDSLNSQRLLYATTSKDGRGSSCQGCQFGGLWISVDAAASWQHVNLCSANNQPDNITSVVFSSGRPFVATDCGIWTTADPGLQTGWAKLGGLPSGVSPGGTIFAPTTAFNTAALVACFGNSSRVYRSPNLGQSWDSGVDVGGRCTGLAVTPVSGTSVAIHTTSGPVIPGRNALEVTVVNHDSATTQNLGFANVAIYGSGRSGVWTAPRMAPPGGASGPGVSYDVFAADTGSFYRYAGNNIWSGNFPLHGDTWWMEFPTGYDGAGNSTCVAYAANDGGINKDSTGSCSLDHPWVWLVYAYFPVWVDASFGLNVAWGQRISGLPANGGPLLFLPTADDDTFIREIGSTSWTNFPDQLGDSGVVLIDPAQPNLALACRNGNYNLFVAPPEQPPTAKTSFFSILAPTNSKKFITGISAPTLEGVKQVLTMPGEFPLPYGDFLAVQSSFTNDFNNCVENGACNNDAIVRNVSAALGPQQAQSSWVDISGSAPFGPGQVAGIYSSGGHSNTTVYVLSSNAPGINWDGTPYQPGHVYKGQSRSISRGGFMLSLPVTSWQPASGSGASSLSQAYNLFVNSYDPNELWAIDLGSSPSAIKVSRDGGQSWTPKPQLKEFATNFGEFEFTCGAFANGPSNYQDKEIFGNYCSMTQMVFPPQSEMRFAILYPGGVAFSNDAGETWIPLNGTNARPEEQPIELPASAFYDPTINLSGDSSLYVALAGKGVKRLDAPFATLGFGKKNTFQEVDPQHILVLGTDNKLWMEQAPFGDVPPSRQQVDGNVWGFQAADVSHVFVLGADGNLWLEQAPFGNVPPSRQQVDGHVWSFGAIDINHVLVLGTDDNLWLEEAPFGNVPPARAHVDENVRIFQGIDNETVLVLGTDGNLWLETVPFGPTSRQQVDGNVRFFQAIDETHILVLGKDDNLWLEQAPFGKVPPSRQHVDGNVEDFQGKVLYGWVWVLGNDGKLWLEQAPFGNVPPARRQVDGSVRAFQVLDLADVLVLGIDGRLWLEHAPFGNVPAAREEVDASVRIPSPCSPLQILPLICGY
jgi:hypothetical protein